MQIENNLASVLNGWTYRIRPAGRNPARLLVMLHGWTGDENSMWQLGRNVPANYNILFPRAPYALAEKGYSWREMTPGTWGEPTLKDLRKPAEQLLGFIDQWATESGIDGKEFNLAGFSQGAAMSLSMLFFFPGRVDKVAALSGFLPGGAEERMDAVKGKQVFMAHGREDELVPVERAWQARNWLEAGGAKVTYCEGNIGHKVDKDCLKKMEIFFVFR